MVEYECNLGYRLRIESSSICDKCITGDCTNPIFEVKVNVLPFGVANERLWLYSVNKPIKERTLRDYYCVLSCGGFKEKDYSKQ